MFGSNLCYFQVMWREKIRRISAVVLALALAVGLVTHGFGKADFGLKSAAADAANCMSMSGTMSGDNDGCGDQSRMPTACAAFCGSVVALPVTAVLLDVVAVDILQPLAGQGATGHISPPDPYPPRPISMS